MGERVTYPASVSPFVPPSPPFNLPGGVYNPTISGVLGSLGAFTDVHSNWSWVRPYSCSAVTATQYYQYKRNCAPIIELPVNLAGPISITRRIEKIPPPAVDTWGYFVAKSGVSAWVVPLP